MSTPALITVALCTYNRHDLLWSAISGALDQTLDRALYEILIVDNSADRAAAEAFYAACAARDSFRVVWSSPPGLSRARNVALETVQTPYIAFIDDDAIPDRDWLSGLLDGFNHDPRIAVAGGPISPIWPNGQPAWIPDEYLGLLTILDRGPTDRTLESHEHLFGANMAFAVAPLRACGGFPVQIGRTGAGTLLSREELEVQDTLKGQGYLIRYVRRAGVRHRVHEDRLSRNWMRSRMAWESASEQLQDSSQISAAHSVQPLVRLAADDPAVRAAVRLFFGTAERGLLTKQLDLVRHFTGLLLAAHRLDDRELEAAFSDLLMQDDQERADLARIMQENASLHSRALELEQLRSRNVQLAASIETYKQLADESSRRLLEHTASTSWKLLRPMQEWASGRPRLRLWLRRMVYLGWWTLQGELLSRIRERAHRRTGRKR
jgi:glycosyltransferase involved in cell wall biosynthesis